MTGTEFDNSLDDTNLNIFQRIPEIDILIVKDLQSLVFFCRHLMTVVEAQA